IEHLGERHQEVGALLGEGDIIANQVKFRALSQEYAELEPIAQAWHQYRQLVADIAGARELLKDPDFKEMAEEEIAAGEARREIGHLGERHQEVGALLGEGDIIANQVKFRALSQEYAELEPIAQAWHQYRQLVADIAGARELLKDPDFKEMAEEEIAAGEARR